VSKYRNFMCLLFLFDLHVCKSKNPNSLLRIGTLLFVWNKCLNKYFKLQLLVLQKRRSCHGDPCGN
jgi:hypothetical protein